MAPSTAIDAQPLELPPLRQDAPGRRALTRGRVLALREPHERQAALQVFDDEVYAASSRGTQAARAGTLERLLAPWQVQLLILTPDKIRLLGAALKAGGYRSAAQYLATAVQLAERRGQVLSPPVVRAIADAKRSCMRGIGPPNKVAGIPLKALAQLHQTDEAVAPRGPLVHSTSSNCRGRGGCSARLRWPQPEHR